MGNSKFPFIIISGIDTHTPESIGVQYRILAIKNLKERTDVINHTQRMEIIASNRKMENIFHIQKNQKARVII